MYFVKVYPSSCLLLLLITLCTKVTNASVFIDAKSFECGPYGFICEGKNRLRLCDGENLRGPAFLCPSNTICNEYSNDVCENSINYIDPMITRNIYCRRNERIADPSIPGCKGYILCIPNKDRFQGIKFKCSGNTLFNGFTRTCSAPDRYKCPIANITKNTPAYFGGGNRRPPGYVNSHFYTPSAVSQKNRPIDCKNYKLRVTEDSTPVKATYFCPSHPVHRGDPIKCTIFSNQYCLTLERDDQDQFVEQTGSAYRRPRPNFF